MPRHDRRAEDAPGDMAPFVLRIGTLNALSLVDKAPLGDKQHGLKWPRRALMVAEQLRELQIDACGIQESRIAGPDLLVTGGYIRVVGGPAGGSLECEV
eukprot:6394712-Alexandrium_andersonii.AAC.1